MTPLANLRPTLIAWIVACYFLPIFILSGYSVTVASWSTSWSILAIGLIIAAVGSMVFLIKTWSWESRIWDHVNMLANSKAEVLLKNRESESAPSVTPEPPQETTVQNDLIEQLDQTLRLNTGLEKQLQQTKEEYRLLETHTQSQLLQKQKLIEEYVGTLAKMRQEIDNRNQEIRTLEGTIADLSYEVKSLVQAAEFKDLSEIAETIPPAPEPRVSNRNYDRSVPPPPYPSELALFPDPPTRPLKTSAISDEAAAQLRRCVEIAQKMTGSSIFGMNSRFGDSGMQPYALEERRFFDNLESENTRAILVYSQKENRLVFANQQIKEVLGVSAEKFVQEFSQVLSENAEEWRQGLQQLGQYPEASLKLSLKTKNGSDKPAQCVMSLIPSGIFKNHIIAVLYF